MFNMPFNPSKTELGTLNFSVSKIPMSFTLRKRGQKVPNHVPDHEVLVRDDTGEVLTVVGKNYGIVQNKELFSDIDRQIASIFSKGKLRGATVRNDLAYSGGICMREYVFPAVKYSKKLADKKANLCFRLVVVNGHGGTALKVIAGAFDGYCLNGTIFGEAQASFLRRHSKGARVADITSQISAAVKLFPKMCKLYDLWASTGVTDRAVKSLLDSTEFSERIREKLFARWMRESEDRGATVWAFYSALTYYARDDKKEFAIRETKRDHKVATLLNRERSVAKVTRSKAWEKLAPQLSEVA